VAGRGDLLLRASYICTTLQPNEMDGFPGPFLFSFFLIIFFYYSQVHTRLGSFLPLPPPPSLTSRPLPLLPTPSIPGRNCFALISNFVVERV
jgi:hypothetical protein